MDITLALGGGGARGNAHLGVLHRLEKEKFRIRAVAGTSFGGVVAAMYAAGHSPTELENMFAGVDQTKLYGRNTSEAPALLGIEGAIRLLDRWLGDKTFDQLKLPCALTAVDINTGTEVVLKDGSVRDAVLATIALPGVFPPRRMGDYSLVDGGTLDPVPVVPARELAPSLAVVAVVLSEPMGQPSHMYSLEIPGIPETLKRGLTRFRFGQAFSVFLRSIEVAGRSLTELRLEADDPDVIIRPDVSEIKLLDKVDVRAVAKLGDRATVEVLPQLRRAVRWHRKLGRQLRSRRRDEE